MKASEIKKFFKDNFGIPVRVRTVAVKHPFAQVWIENQEPDHRKPLRYDHEFPAELGQRLLDIIYGGQTENIRFPAGNVERHRMSFSAEQFDKLKAFYPPKA